MFREVENGWSLDEKDEMILTEIQENAQNDNQVWQNRCMSSSLGRSSRMSVISNRGRRRVQSDRPSLVAGRTAAPGPTAGSADRRSEELIDRPAAIWIDR